MAEGFTFEHYHIPQQSRREKLRVLSTQNNRIPGFVEPSSSSSSHNTLHPGINIAALPSLYDPLIPSDFGGSVKEEGSNLMMRFTTGVGGVVNGSSCSNSSSSSSVSHHHHHHHHANYLDPESSLHINPAIQVINSNNPFLYQPQSLQNLRDQFNHSYNDGSDDQVMVFKPEPLSLSLSSHNNNNTQHNQANHHLHQRYGSVIYGGGSEVVTARNYSVPLGPFTGYASVLKGSRFLKPAQQLLEEICDVGVRAAGVCAVSEKITADASLMMETTSHEESLLGVDDDSLVGDHGSEGSRKNKSRLLTMLDEVYRRYRQYYQQIHAVVTSFEYVAGLGNAAPYASLAINAMSKHFRCLKNVITDQLQFISKSHNFQISNNRKDESPRFCNSDGVGPYNQRPGFLDHQQPVWRPQRGLPERAVSVLRAWLFEHFLHPYPTDSDKLMLAKQTGLSRNQVSNWFINARVRLWKPMVEEIHMLESQQAQKKSQRGEEHSRNNNNLSDHHHLPSSDNNNNNNNIVNENNPSTTSMDKFQDVPYKRTRSELVANHMPVMRSHHHEQQLNQTKATSSNHHQQVAAASVGGVSMHHGNNGVSLTLGLHHQNHGIAGLSDHQPFSNMSAAQRFGLALQPDHHGYVSSGGFDSQNRQQFGRDHVIGGQLLHDFVG